MQIASFEYDGQPMYGVSAGDGIRAASAALRVRHPDLMSLLRAGALGELVTDTGGALLATDEVSFLPVIPRPDKTLCVGVNYRPHIEEMGREVPDYPVIFVRFPGSQVGHAQPIVRPRASEQLDFEGELAVVIGKPARHVDREAALGYVAGYCCFMDGSVRDWQRHTMQFTAGKNFDRSGASGPWLVTSDEVGDPTRLELTTRVNGEVMQHGRLADLLFDLPFLIEYCSTFTELLPGDLIATGTPAGVGAARKPPRWLRDGDIVEVDIPGVGLLCNPVRDE